MEAEVVLLRGHNEGSIFQRRTGEWVAAVTMRNGKRATRWSKSRDEAKADLAELLRLRDAGARETGRVRLGSYLERWVSRDHDMAPATLRKHESIIRIHLIPALGHVRLSELSPEDVSAALVQLRGLDPRTVVHVRATLRRCLADAHRAGLVSRNVAALARPPKLPHRERPILDGPGARLLLDSSRGTRYGPLWTILVTTGMRISEALGLTWSNVTPDAIHVRQALQRVAGEWELRKPKTAKGRRTIPLTDLGRDALREQRRWQSEVRYGAAADAPGAGGAAVGGEGSSDAGGVWQRTSAQRPSDSRHLGRANRPHYGEAGPVSNVTALDGLVFTTDRGNAIHATNLLPKLRADLAAAGLPKVGLHDLRHSCATILFERGLPIEAIADILGHSTTRVTADLYRHRVERFSVLAAEKMQEALG